MGLIPQLRRSPGGGHGNPFKYSRLENPMDRGAWPVIVHGVAKSWTRKDRKPGWRLRFWIFLKSQRNQELFLTRQLRQNEQYHFDHGRDTVPIFIVENCLPLYKGNNQEGVGSWPFPVTKTDHPTPVLLKELHCVFPLPLSLDISPTPSCWCLWCASSLGCQRESSLFCPCI